MMLLLKNVTPKHKTSVRSVKKTQNLKDNDYGVLKKTIVKEIIQNGNQSHFQIRQKFKSEKKYSKFSTTDRSSIIRTFNQLLKEGWTGLVNCNPKSGGSEKFYGLTDDGIKQSINYKLSDDYFWQLCINYINKNYTFREPYLDKQTNKIKFKNKKTIIDLQVQQIFKLQYPSLSFYMNYFNLFGTIKTFQLVNDLQKTKIDFCIKSIPILLAYAKHDDKEIQKYWEKDDEFILKMYEYGLLYSVEDVERISIFGIMLLINIILSPIHLENKQPTKKLFDKISKIIKMNQDELPLVFSKWDELRKTVNDDKRLLNCLLYPFVIETSKIHQMSIDSPELRILVDHQYIEYDFRAKLREIFDSGMGIISQWSIEKNCHDELFESSNVLKDDFKIKESLNESIKTQTQTIAELQRLDVMVGNSRWNKFEFYYVTQKEGVKELKSLQNTISFYFYTLLDFYTSNNESLDKFFQTNPKIIDWKNNYIDVLNEYRTKSNSQLKITHLN